MEEATLFNLWKSYDQKLEESLQLNRKNAEDITRMKIQSMVSSMKPLKNFTFVIGLLWVAFGGLIVTNLFVFAFGAVSKFFLFSAALQLLLTAMAVGVYAYQLILISEVNISQPVLETQEHLANLKTSTLWVTRILLLQLPVWTTFYLSEYAILHGSIVFLVAQALVTLAATYAALWLFVNIRYENKDKKWFRLIFEGREWTPLLQSMELLSQVKELRKESTRAPADR